MRWNTISSWYFGSSHSLYFDLLCQSSILKRFQIMLKPDLSGASLHVINLWTHFSWFQFFILPKIQDLRGYPCLRSIWSSIYVRSFCHLTRRCSQDVNTRAYAPLFSCRASGRFVVQDSSNRVTVLDIFDTLLIISSCRGYGNLDSYIISRDATKS